MKTITLLTLACLSGGAAGAADAPSPATASATFARIKKLAGDWEGNVKTIDGPRGTVRYEITAGGTAVKETVFPGSEHEMLTVFHLEGDDLVLTHYCAAGNQPRMKLKSATAAEAFFEFGGAGIRSAAEGHMHDARFRFLADDRLESDWTFFADGKAAGTERFFLSRRK